MLPPSSRIVLPNLSPTSCATLIPTRVLPVAEIKGTRLSERKLSPTVFEFPATRFITPSGTLFFLSTAERI